MAWCVGRRVVCHNNDRPPPTLVSLEPGVSVRLAVRRKAELLQSKAARHMAAHNRHAVVTGGPGTGKTTMYAEFVKAEIKQGRDVIVCAPTATAASHLPDCRFNGRQFNAVTISRMILAAFWKRDAATRPGRKPRLTTVLIDEFSMANAGQIDGVHRAMTARGPDKPFRIVMGGDIQQLPPPSGASPIASEFVANLIDEGADVYRLHWNWRFQHCERMHAFNKALRARDFNASLEFAVAATLQNPRVADKHHRARHVAYTHRQLAFVNKGEHQRLLRSGARECTYWGKDGSKLVVCAGEMMVVRENVFDKEAMEYTQRNGQVGVVILDSDVDTVVVTADTLLKLRLVNGDLLNVKPKLVDGPAKAKISTFVGMVAPCTGFTAHAAQGATMAAGDTLTIDMQGIPCFELALVVLTRHPYFKQIRIINFDLAKFKRLFTLCPCGHDQRPPTAARPAVACSDAQVAQRAEWDKFVDTHVVHVPFGYAPKTSAV
jgi:hypothetical protein